MPELPPEDRNRLQHMLDATRGARRMIAGHGRDDLTPESQLSLALQRLIEILGEAAKNVTPETREKAALVPWKEMAGMRDRLIHAYFDVDLDVLWNAVTIELPAVESELVALLAGE